MLEGLEGKVALVTGGGRGLGRAHVGIGRCRGSSGVAAGQDQGQRSAAGQEGTG